jgi:pimeloyl-ACP methyl ester carboxylesterase
LIAAAFAALALLMPQHARVDDPCLDKARDRAVTMNAYDGARIYGVETGKGAVGVVLAHQYLSDHCEFMSFAHELAGRGYRVLAIDLRGYGASRGGVWWHLDRDLVAAAARLRADGAKRVVLVGASMGGTAALVAGAEAKPAVAGVVSLSGPAQFRGLDAAKAVRHLRAPVRFLAARSDPPSPSDARRLNGASASRDKSVALFDGAAHGSSLLSIPPAKALLLAFLRRV